MKNSKFTKRFENLKKLIAYKYNELSCKLTKKIVELKREESNLILACNKNISYVSIKNLRLNMLPLEIKRIAVKEQMMKLERLRKEAIAISKLDPNSIKEMYQAAVITGAMNTLRSLVKMSLNLSPKVKQKTLPKIQFPVLALKENPNEYSIERYIDPNLELEFEGKGFTVYSNSRQLVA